MKRSGLTFFTVASLLCAPTALQAQDAPEDRAKEDAKTSVEKAQETLQNQKVRVRILASPSQATILGPNSTDKILGKGSAVLDLLPGSYEVQIQHPGYKTHIETLAIGPHAPEILLRVQLSKLGPAPVVQTMEPGLVDGLKGAREPVAWASMGVGALLIAGSIALAAQSQVDERCSQMEPMFCEGAQEFAAWSALLGILGGVGLTTGVGLLLWPTLAAHPKEGESTTAPKKEARLTGLQVFWVF